MDLDKRLERIERTVVLAFKRALDVSDVALLLGVSESRVRHMTSEGLLPYSKPNGRIYFDKADIERYLLSNRQHSQAEIDSIATTHIATSRIR